MPSGRIVLKSISQSRKMARLKSPSLPGDGPRLLYTWLLTHVDINGCFSGDAAVVKGLIFTLLPHSVEKIEAYLAELEKEGLIIRYTAKGEKQLQIPDFKEKQPYLNPDREGKPLIPLPPKGLPLSSGPEAPALSSKGAAGAEVKQIGPAGIPQSATKPPKTKPAPIPEVKLIIDLYFKYYVDPHIGGYKVKPLIQGKPEGDLLRKLIPSLKRDEVWGYTEKPFMDVMSAVLKSYLLDRSDFLQKRKHDLRLFYSSFNTWWLPVKEALWAQYKAQQRSGAPRSQGLRHIGDIVRKLK